MTSSNLPSQQSLFEALDSSFNINELQGLCSRLAIDWEDLEGDNKSAKIRELISFCDRHDRLKSLVQHLKELRPTKKFALEQPVENLQSKRNDEIPSKPTQDSYNFENQARTLQEILDKLSKHPYLHLYGPSGIGKTYVALTILHKYYHDNLRAYVDFNRQKFDRTRYSIEALLRTIYSQLLQDVPNQTKEKLRETEQIINELAELNLTQEELIEHLAALAKRLKLPCIVVLDNADRARSELLQNLRESVIPRLEELIHDPNAYLRFVIVTQKSTVELRGRWALPFKQQVLQEFSDDTAYLELLKQAYRRFAGRNFTQLVEKRLLRLSNELRQLTHGHPKAIQFVLDYVGSKTRFADNKTSSILINSKEICEKALTPLIDVEIESQIDDLTLVNALKQLFIFRFLPGNSIFKSFMIKTRENHLSWESLIEAAKPGDYDPEATIYPLRTKIGEYQSFFLPGHEGNELPNAFTPIWRKLSNTVLKATNLTLYQAQHADAYSIYYKFAFDASNPFSYKHFLEALYHYSQNHYQEDPNEKSQEDFTNDVCMQLGDFLDMLAKTREPNLQQGVSLQDISDSTLQILESDLELAEALRHCGTDTILEQLRNLLKEKAR